MGSRWRLALLAFYVSAVGLFAANDLFRWDLFHWPVFTPELRLWVYELTDLFRHDPAEAVSKEEACRRLKELASVLARTRYERTQPSGSLEEEVQAAVKGASAASSNDDDEFRRRAADLLARGQEEAHARLLDIEEFAALPILVKRLEDDSPRVRRGIFQALRAIADRGWKMGDLFGYDPDAPEPERAAAARRWRDWVRSLDL